MSADCLACPHAVRLPGDRYHPTEPVLCGAIPPLRATIDDRSPNQGRALVGRVRQGQFVRYGGWPCPQE